MFTSNFDDPIQLKSASEGAISWTRALGRFRAGFLAITDNPWVEITGAGPTPTFLQPYASNITGITDDTNPNSFTRKICFYLSTDPGLLAAPGNPVNGSETPHARLIRISAGYYGCRVHMISTLHADPSDIGNWASLSAGDNDGYSQTGQEGFLYGNGSSSLSSPGRVVSTILIWDDLIYVGQSTDGTPFGGMLLYYPESVPADLVTRATFPLFLGQSASYNSNSYYGQQWTRPGFGAFSPSMTQIGDGYELGFLPQTSDLLGREFVQRLHLWHTSNGLPWWSGMIPQIRVMRSGMSKGYQQARNIGGVRHIEIKNRNGAILLLREEDPVI